MARFYVDCPDGHVRHDGAFATRVAARHFADWGHACLAAEQHQIEEHPDDCPCGWCEQERGAV